MKRWPRKWIAALLAGFFQPLGMLYVARPWLAVFYFVVLATAGLFDFPRAGRAEHFTAFIAVVVVVCAGHAYLLAARHPPVARRPWYSRWHGLLPVAGVFCIITVAVRSFVVEPFRSPSGAMCPGIARGDNMLALKWGYGHYGTFGWTLARRPVSASLDRGDIIIFEYPGDRSVHYVKRLVGLPGDTVSYRGHRMVINDVPVATVANGDFIDGPGGRRIPQFVESLFGRTHAVAFDPLQPAAPPTLPKFIGREHCTSYPDGIACRIPPAHLFVLGDNRVESADSRSWGLVPLDHMVGRVTHVVQ